jgi:SSS family solute:Na+ symporter
VDIIKPLKSSLSQKKVLYLSRWSIVVLGAGSLVLALALKGVVNALLFAYTVYTCGLILPVIAGFYKSRLRVTSLGALAAVIGGGSVALISKLFVVKYLDVVGLLVGAMLLFVVSFIENKLKMKKSSKSVS